MVDSAIPANANGPNAQIHDVDCVIVGAGWTGLATAAALRAYGVKSFVMLDAGPGPGAFWEGNYERIRLHTPWHGLPCDGGMALYKYPMFKPKKEVVQYLRDYHQLHGLEPYSRFFERVERVENHGPGSWQVETTAACGRHIYQCRFVSICTSKLRVPFMPEIAGQDTFQGRVLHSRAYSSGRDFLGQDVLVVGSGNSAAEICADLVECGAGSVTMLVNGPRLFIPLPRLGVAAWWGCLLGRLTEERAYEEWKLEFGSKEFEESVKKKDAVMAKMSVDLSAFGINAPDQGFSEASIKEGRIGVFDQGAIYMIRKGKIAVRKGRLSSFTNISAVFDDGTSLAVDSVVLATGFQPKLEEFLAEPHRFLETGQEGKGCALFPTPRTDSRCRSSVDSSLFFVGFDVAVNAGLSMGFWGWNCGFLIARDLGLQPKDSKFSLDMLPERQRDMKRQRWWPY